MTTIDGKALEAVKAVATDFFRWWWNTPGTNTDQGFDEWAAGPGAAAITAALAALPSPKIEGAMDENGEVSEQLTREVAVTIVDANHQYTMEFAPSPAEHAAEYDRVQQAVTYALNIYLPLYAAPSPVLLADEGVAERAKDVAAAFKFWNDVQQITSKHGCLGGDNVLAWLDANLPPTVTS